MARTERVSRFSLFEEIYEDILMRWAPGADWPLASVGLLVGILSFCCFVPYQ